MRRVGWIHPTVVWDQPAEDRSAPDSDESTYPPKVRYTATVEAFCTIDAGTSRNTTIGDNTWLMKGCHVGHDALIGKDCELAPHCVIGGWVEIGDGSKLGMNVTVKPKVKIGDGAQIGCGAVITKDVPAGEVWVGNPGRYLRMRSEVHDASPED